jgi:cell division protein FtsI/penicillin-binding protein 2
MENIKTLFDYLVAFSPTILAIFAIIFAYLSNRQLIKENRKLQKEEYKNKIKYYDRSEIYRKLNDVYAPLQLLRRISAELHAIFKNGRDFKTLSELVDGKKFGKNDEALLIEIIRIGDKCKKIIIDNSGLIDDQEFRDKHLPKLLTHYLLIKNVHKGKLVGESERFKNFTFPNEIDEIIDKRVNDLNDELKKLTGVV